jgi:N4-gp56 family major capsid protein
MPLNYNAPVDGQKSSIDKGGNADQMQTFMWLKSSLVTARKEQYFMPLASVTNMPKNFGKRIKLYEYIPLLDDRNINDQGIDATGATIVDGNLYGSSKDIGKITAKLPTLGENGGRVNRVGFTRIEREGTFHKFGMFYEWTQESLDFDSDPELAQHLATELMNGAVQMTESQLQMDLLASPGVVMFSGAATSKAQISGEKVTQAGQPDIPVSVVSYKNLSRLDQILTDNRSPTSVKIITGSRLVDTQTLGARRVMYVGSEVVPVLEGMTDLFGNPAWVPVQKYGDAGTLMNGEIGAIGKWRFIQVPEMLHWAGAGAPSTDANEGYRTSTVGGVERYDVFPMLTIGDDSFTTIGFQTDGKTVKFNVITKMPGKETADKTDPYGEQGFSSMKWYYGFLLKRPERLGVVYTVAPL